MTHYHKPKPAKNIFTYSSLILESLKAGTKPLRRKPGKNQLTDKALEIIRKEHENKK